MIIPHISKSFKSKGLQPLIHERINKQTIRPFITHVILYQRSKDDRSSEYHNDNSR